MGGEREVVYCVFGESEMDISDPETWVSTGSDATTIEGLKRSLRSGGNPCIPRKFHVLIGMRGGFEQDNTIRWELATEGAMRKWSPEGHLPEGPLRVYVLPK